MQLSGMSQLQMVPLRSENALKRSSNLQKHTLSTLSGPLVLFSQGFIWIWTESEPTSASDTFQKPSQPSPHDAALQSQGLEAYLGPTLRTISQGKAWPSVFQQSLPCLHTQGKRTSLRGAALFTQKVGSLFQQPSLTSCGSSWNGQRAKLPNPNAALKPCRNLYKPVVCWEHRENGPSPSSQSKLQRVALLLRLRELQSQLESTHNAWKANKRSSKILSNPRASLATVEKMLLGWSHPSVRTSGNTAGKTRTNIFAM